MRWVRLASLPVGEGRLLTNTDTGTFEMSGTIQPPSTWCLRDLPSHLFLARAGNQDSREETAHNCSVSQLCLEILMTSSRERLLPVLIT